MEKVLTVKEYERMTDELDKVKYRCKCGRRVVIPKRENKKLCTWCGNYVFRDKRDEFEYRLKEKIK